MPPIRLNLVGMAAAQDELFCYNHPNRATGLRCSACDRPICLSCSRESAVGMKCPSCSTPPLRARMIGKPRQYFAGAFTGFACGFGAVFLLRALRFGFVGFLIPVVTGYLIGALVVKASGGHGHSRIQWTAAVSTGLGLITGAVLAGGARLGSDPRFLFSALIAAGLAAVAAGR